MLEANKSKWFEKVFSTYNRNLIKRRFQSFNVLGLDNLRNRNKDVPTIIYANHSSWWDGLLAFQIAQEVNTDFYVMMEEKQLKVLPLFRKLGAFSVVRENPRSAVESINYAIKLLEEKSNISLCLFPQGKILPNDKRPIKFYHGISRIIEKVSKCQIFCFAMRLEFLSGYKPDIFLKIGESDQVKVNKNFDTKQHTLKMANDLENSLDELKNLILVNDPKKFKNLIK